MHMMRPPCPERILSASPVLAPAVPPFTPPLEPEAVRYCEDEDAIPLAAPGSTDDRRPPLVPGVRKLHNLIKPSAPPDTIESGR